MPGLSFRAARPSDHAQVLSFVLAMARESEGASPDGVDVARGLDAALADPAHRRYFVAERDGRPVGCCLVTSEWSDWTGRWYWWVQSVYVLPEERGGASGVWRGLYAFVCGEARRNDVRKVLLYVHEENQRAQRAYEAVGMRRARYLVYEAPLPP